jgi:hypothetical protein
MTEVTLHHLRASLRPRVYRDIEIESGLSLFELAQAITKAFGFDFDHAFGFFSRLTGRVFDSPVRYELFSDEGMGGKSLGVKRATVAQAFPKIGSKMLFVYDYGDEWRFAVELRELSQMQPGSALSKMTAVVGKAPNQYAVTLDDIKRSTHNASLNCSLRPIRAAPLRFGFPGRVTDCPLITGL